MLKQLACMMVVAVPTAATAQSLVCAGKIINEGVSQVLVSAKCGPPTQVDHRTTNLGSAVVSVDQRGRVAGLTADVDVEIWTYNFGTSRLMQRIWFQDGTVVRVESLGYGF
jgi:hypothetical protein